MCLECPPEVVDLAKRLDAYFSAHNNVIVEGLHIIIEDGNVQDEHIKWCQDNYPLDQASREFAADLLAMPLPYRHAAVSMAWERDFD